VDYFIESDGVVGAQRCTQRDTTDRVLTIDGNEIRLSDVRDVVFRSL